MGNSQITKDTLYSQSNLLRALYIRTSALKHSINEHRIKLNYHTISPDLKSGQTRLKLSRFSARKLIEIKQILKTLPRASNSKKLKSRFISKLEELQHKNYLKFVEFPCPEATMLKELRKNEDMKEHLRFLEGIKDGKLKEFEQNNEKLNEVTKKGVEISKKQNEIADLSHYYSFLKTRIQFLEQKMNMQVKRESIRVISQTVVPLQSVFVLRTSRELLEKYRKRVDYLVLRLDKRMALSDSKICSVRCSAESLDNERRLDEALEGLGWKEDVGRGEVGVFGAHGDY